MGRCTLFRRILVTRIFRQRSWPVQIGVLFLAVVPGGCESRPHAPALGDEPVYQNNREGFKFLAPEGWRQFAKADVPASKAEKERQLVAYERTSSDKPAVFDVTLADLPESVQLSDHVTGPSYGVMKWKSAAPSQQIEVSGVSAVRFVLESKVGGESRVKEVVAFRRGERVYFFTGLFEASDNSGREEIRHAISSIQWKR